MYWDSGVQLPSRRPALVCESCLYSKDEMIRLRGFHVLDPRGLLDFIGVFEERKDNVESISCDEDIIQVFSYFLTQICFVISNDNVYNKTKKTKDSF